jgi:hypothetical protein
MIRSQRLLTQRRQDIPEPILTAQIEDDERERQRRRDIQGVRVTYKPTHCEYECQGGEVALSRDVRSAVAIIEFNDMLLLPRHHPF